MTRFSRLIRSTIFSACVATFTCSMQDAGNSQDVSSGAKKVCGTIYDTCGIPVAGARVVLRPHDYLPEPWNLAKVRARGPSSVCSTTTDPRGRFYFTNGDSLLPALYALEATSADGMTALFIDSLLLDSAFIFSATWLAVDTPEYSMALAPVAGIHGVVRLPERGEVRGAVQVYGLGRSVQLHDDGTYSIESLPPGNLRLRFAIASGDSVLNGTFAVKTTPGEEATADTLVIIPVDLQTGGEAPSFIYWVAAADTEVIILPDSPGEIREGYRFTGWNTSADGSGTTYPPGDTVGSLDSIDGLFAQWASEADPAATTAIVSTVFWCSHPFVNDSDAIYYASVSDTFTPGITPRSAIVRVDKTSGDTQMYVFDNFSTCWNLCGEGAWLYFSKSFDSAVYRVPKSLKDGPEQITRFTENVRLFGAAGGGLYLGFPQSICCYHRMVRYNMTDGALDTLASGVDWFGYDDQACYWSVLLNDSTYQTGIFRSTFTSGGNPVELSAGEFHVVGMDDNYIYVYNLSRDTIGNSLNTYAEADLLKIDKTAVGNPVVVLKKNDHFREDDAFIVIDDIVYVANLSGELWSIPVGNPVGGAQLIDKWGPYDDDDFTPQLFRDSDDLYWIAGPDPGVRISDNDPGVLLRTRLQK